MAEDGGCCCAAACRCATSRHRLDRPSPQLLLRALTACCEFDRANRVNIPCRRPGIAQGGCDGGRDEAERSTTRRDGLFIVPPGCTLIHESSECAVGRSTQHLSRPALEPLRVALTGEQLFWQRSRSLAAWLYRTLIASELRYLRVPCGRRAVALLNTIHQDTSTHKTPSHTGARIC